MASSSTRTKENCETESSIQMIVQCPGCQTRFAVEAESIASVEFPRFHCSRCDHVFSIEEGECKEVLTGAREPLVRTSPPVSAPLSEPTTVPEDSASSTPSLIEDSYSNAPSPAGLSRPSIATQNSTSTNVEPDRGSRALEIPRIFETGHRVTPPHESVVDEPTPTTRVGLHPNPSESKQPSSANQKNDVGQIEFGFDHNSSKDGNEGLASPQITSLARDPFIFRHNPPTKTSNREATSTNESLNLWDPNRPALETDSRPNNPFFVFLAPVALILIFLVGASLYLRADLGSADRLTSALFPSAPRVAPAGLSIQSPNFRTVLLESGDKVHVISGKIVNQTENSFRDVQIEGLAFNGAGQPLTEVRTRAGSALAKTRLKSLSVDMISSLQTSNAPKHFELKPDGEMEFALALLDDKVKDARYFTTRIYSVRQ